MKKILLLSLLAAILGIFVGWAISYFNRSTILGDSSFPNNIYSATNASTTVQTASTQILSNNGARQYASICNDSASAVVYLSFGSIATSSKGYRLDSKACFTMPNPVYVGIVSGIASATTTVTTIEK